MSEYNKKKTEQLGMPIGTASNRLRKSLLWKYVQKAGEDTCFQCGEVIESVNDLSIEHKTPWLDSEDPAGLFFDLDNISFSHLSCNIGAARREKLADIFEFKTGRKIASNVVIKFWAKENGYHQGHLSATARFDVEAHKGVYARYK